MGAYHFSELPLLAGTHPVYRSNSTPFEYAVSEKMQALWRQFAVDPENGLAKEGWPDVGSTGKVMGIALTPQGQESVGPNVLDLIDVVPGDAQCSESP